jgi:hypothetical protein
VSLLGRPFITSSYVEVILLYFCMHASWRVHSMWTFGILTWLSCLFSIVCSLLETFDVVFFLFLDEGKFYWRG